jgi:hypothetical protein
MVDIMSDADVPNHSRGLLWVQNNDDIDEQEASERRAEEAQSNPVITSLSAHIASKWERHRSAKHDIEQRMLKNIRQRDGIYDPDDLAKILKQKDPEIYMRVTGIKCHALKSWLKDIIIPPGERPFSLDATPEPDLSPQMDEQIKARIVAELQQKMAQTGMTVQDIEADQQGMIEIGERVKKEVAAAVKDESEDAAADITNKVDDELTEGGWYRALDEVIDDVVDLPCGILHGPAIRTERVLDWSDTGEPSVQTKLVKSYERVSPFDVYPAPTAKSLQDGDLIVRVQYYPYELSRMVDVPGWDSDSLNRVLVQWGIGGLSSTWTGIDYERAKLEGRPYESTSRDDKIDALKYMGRAFGRQLIEWGMTEREISDPNETYDIIAYLIGNYVVSARINPHPLGKRRYYSASFRRKNDSIWGDGVPDVMRDCQRICNGAARALVKNMSISSGPQLWVIADRFPPETVITDIYPNKIWPFNSGKVAGRSEVPMGFFQPNINSPELFKVFKEFYDLSSEITGIPAYVYGSEKVGGAGRTASGLSMLLNAAGKGIKSVAGHIDKGIIETSVGEHWLHIMLTEPGYARGDIKAVARASSYLVQMERLQMMISDILAQTNNPTDLAIMGREGRSELLRKQFETLRMGIDTDKIVPGRDEVADQVAQEKVQEAIGNIAQALGADPARIMQIAMGQQPQGGSPQ